ncbi:MAG: hypothetical protein Kow0022_00540 [Phycisphaerales bacterium]
MESVRSGIVSVGQCSRFADAALFGTPDARDQPDMTSGLPNQPVLRLVDTERFDSAPVLPKRNAESPLRPGDARWVFAVRVAAAIEGERAAVLTPEKRARLMKLAAMLGLRDFDATLIIAIVQDSARCGVDPLGQTTAERVAMVRRPAPARDDSWQWFVRTAWVSALGAGGALMLVKLFGG